MVGITRLRHQHIGRGTLKWLSHHAVATAGVNWETAGNSDRWLEKHKRGCNT
jgi:hypothetical protein